jgi:uncharacterized protein involved in response to NO
MRSPILAVLHLAYAMLALGFALRGLTQLVPAIPPTPAMHLLTVGALGMMTYGMLTRVALGHTGRPLKVSRPTIVGYLAIAASALIRVAVPLADPARHEQGLLISGGLWSMAFLIYLWQYLPILLRARPDGKPG